jgi:nucleotide-binding universal stress UspA family protein
MTRDNALRVLVATDGSAQARAAVAATGRFPWPERTRVRIVVARRTRAEYRQSILLAALDRSADLAAAAARHALSDRWPDAEVAVVDRTPVDAVLGEARRFGADVIVVGWRGLGAVRRLLMGSVSRGVVRGADCSVLVVRGRPGDLRRIVIGLDGSPGARRAVAFVARLTPPRGGLVTLVTAVERMAPPSRVAPRAARAALAQEIARLNEKKSSAARQMFEQASDALGRRGWRTRTAVGNAAPLRSLLTAVDAAHAQLLVVGARGASGVRHLLLGSVAEGALNRCPVPVLVVR